MLLELQSKWDTILEYLKKEYEVPDVVFKTWLRPLQIHSVNNDLITLVTEETDSGVKYITKRFYNPLKVSISEIMNHEFDISIISKEDINNFSGPTEDNSFKERVMNSGLEAKNTFDSFVVGESNDFAHAASLAVANAPGESYNPLFIYGGVGLGKTHLMQAIGNHIIKNNPSLKVTYVTSEKFTNELIESIKTEKNSSNKAFREKYRNVDVLMIDDIQFIIGKESTQNEFFHTFNTLKDAKKQIIITSDRPPKNFETLEERLRSRFEWGLIADIAPPNYETRMAILQKKAQIEHYNVDNEIMDYIASNVKSNIRELEGSLTKLVAYSRLKHTSTINIEFAEEVLKDIISPNAKREITPTLIIETVADHFGILYEDIKSQKRDAKIAYPRHIAIYLCRIFTDIPLDTIGSFIGKRDHSTILHSINKIESELKSNDPYNKTKEHIEALKKKINPT